MLLLLLLFTTTSSQINTMHARTRELNYLINCIYAYIFKVLNLLYIEIYTHREHTILEVLW